MGISAHEHISQVLEITHKKVKFIKSAGTNKIEERSVEQCHVKTAIHKGTRTFYQF